MAQRSIMGSEAGLMLMAEEFDFLGDATVLRIMLAVSQKGPLTRKEIVNLGFGKPYRIKNIIRFLVEDGRLVKVKRVYKPDGQFKPPVTYVQYFCADEFVAAAIHETMCLLERTHTAYADGFKRLQNDLRPLF